MRSPSEASLTRILHRPASRLAYDRVNPGGMCCVMTTPGESGGRFISTSLVASVPPVDAPMKISFSVDSRPIDCGAALAAAAPADAALGMCGFETRALDAV